MIELDAAAPRADRGPRVHDARSRATTDQVAWVEEWTGGAGADVVFEVSGAAAAVLGATALAKVRGTIVVVAIHPTPREIDLQRVFWRELRILGARVYQRHGLRDAPSSSSRTASSPPTCSSPRSCRSPRPQRGVRRPRGRAGDEDPRRRAGGAGVTRASFDLTGTTAVVTGASRGIGFAMAEALAAAGADIIGVSAHARADRAARSRRPSRRTAATFEAHRRATSPTATPSTRSAPTLADATRRHPRQQRRHDRARARRRAPARAVGPRARRSTSRASSCSPRRIGRGDARARPRQDHLHRVAAELPGRHQRARLRRGEVRHRRAHQGARQRMGAARRQRQRDRARLHRDRQHPGAARRPRPLDGDPRAHPGRALGRAPTTSPVRPSSSPRRASDYVSGIVLPVDGGWLGR